ncbi:MAG: type IV pilus modification protein PilV [Gammaproteobacteria bacterium]|jgi:type IV pilus assembly protein PilV
MHALKEQQGFSLIEVLIALVVLSVGLLGIAGLETSGMRNTYASNLQSQAAMLAQNMVDRIRANPDGIKSGVFDGGITAQPGSAPGTDCASNVCTPAQMMNYDIYYWYSDVATLPSGGAEITCQDASCTRQSVFTVTIRWDGRGNGATGTGCDPDNSSDLLCYRVNFIPSTPATS